MGERDPEFLLEKQKAAFRRDPPDYRRRVGALEKLNEGLREYEETLVEALYQDFGGRAREETLLLELFPLRDKIRHVRSHLKGWMKPENVRGNWYFWPSRNHVEYEALGAAGILGAWNYQILLALGPLVDALAAGNHVMLKPSEVAPRSARVISEMIAERYPPEYVTCLTGGPDLASRFASLPFDHLFFTGSGRVGRKVMEAAARNLTPVTLELGGKSPAIVHESYPLDTAAKRIMAGKLLNAGQTCVAPDYLLLPEGREEEFEREARRAVNRFYPKLVEGGAYTRIIDGDHYARLRSALEEARQAGARLVTLNPAGEKCTPENRVIPPTLAFHPPEETELMREEIFGPVLPVLSYHSLEEAISTVNSRPRPLALYYFDRSGPRIRRMLKETSSGGVTVNDCLFHLGQHNLPWGGVGESGMGKYHGFDGFATFSNRRAVMRQRRWAGTALLRPPFGRWKRRLIRMLLRLTGR